MYFYNNEYMYILIQEQEQEQVKMYIFNQTKVN